jgi:VanZ family protein
VDELSVLAFVLLMTAVPWMMQAPAVGRGAPSHFTSDRERRLWLWTLAVVAAIYSTMGPAQRLAAGLRERNLLRLSFAVVLFMVVATIVHQWMKKRRGIPEIGVAIGVMAVYFMVIARVASWEERTHLFEYGLVAVLIHQALLERQQHGGRVKAPAALAIVAAALIGWLDEGIQAVLPNRVYDIRDVGFNALAGLMAVGSSLAMTWARRLVGDRSRRRSTSLHT